MARKPSNALKAHRPSKRVRAEKPTPETEAQPEPQPESLVLPLPLLFAAELVSSKDDPRPGLQTVFAHRKGNAVRLVATDGTRMFISSFKPGKETILPSWLEKGVMISTDALRPRLNLLRQLEGASVAMLRYTVDQPTAILADANERSMFRIGIDTHNKFPEYENVLREDSFGGTLDGEGNIAGGGEWQAVGFNSTYLRHVNDIAKALSAGLSKHEKERGMVVRAFQGAPTAPQVFDFSAWPGAILIVMPHHLPEFSREAAAILSPVTKGRIAALKAHATRWRQLADQTTDEAQKAEAIAKADSFQVRIRNIQRGETPAIEGPAESPEAPESTPDAPHEGNDAADETPSVPPATNGEAEAEPAEPRAEEPEPKVVSIARRRGVKRATAVH